MFQCMKDGQASLLSMS